MNSSVFVEEADWGNETRMKDRRRRKKKNKLERKQDTKACFAVKYDTT